MLRNNRLSLYHNGRAFTLIEVLAVITIIGILAGITFGAFKGVQESTRRSLARGELATIASALESYKLKNGDYPWLNSPSGSQGEVLFESLAGKDVYSSPGKPKMRSVNGDSSQNGKGGPYIDINKFTLGKKVSGEIELIEVDRYDNEQPNIILDPWGEPYYYRYKEKGSSNTWVNPAFVLWSGGAYRETQAPVTKPSFISASGLFKIDDFKSIEENEDDLVYGYTD